MSKIAVIGFGSLLWDLDDLAPKVSGKWKMYEGPVLPLEFSLVSKKRHFALALVIDYLDGAHCPTCVIDSIRSDISASVADLAERERMAPSNIGFIDRDSGQSHSHRNHPGHFLKIGPVSVGGVPYALNSLTIFSLFIVICRFSDWFRRDTSPNLAWRHLCIFR